MHADDDSLHPLAAHVEQYHLPPPRHGPLTAVPFPDTRIPDVELAHMVEAIEEEDLAIGEVCARFQRPLSLVLRELTAYYRRHQRWIVQYAWQCD